MRCELGLEYRCPFSFINLRFLRRPQSHFAIAISGKAAAQFCTFSFDLHYQSRAFETPSIATARNSDVTHELQGYLPQGTF